MYLASVSGSRLFTLVRLREIRLISYVPRKKNYYEILGIDQKASLDEIKQAFADETRKLHPDSKGWTSNVVNSTEKLMLLKEAYDILKKPEKKKEYDRELEFSKKVSREMFFENLDDDGNIINLNIRGPQGYRGATAPIRASRVGHFFDPSKELEIEKHNERIWWILGGAVIALIVGNIVFVTWYNSKRLKSQDKPVIS